MNKVITFFVAMFMLSMGAMAKQKQGKDYEPDHKIGNLFCYKAWVGDRWEGGHVVLTDKPLRYIPPVAKNDPVGVSADSRSSVKVIDIHIDYLDSVHKRVSYNDRSFYNTTRRAAAESCFQKLFPGQHKKVKKTEVKFLPKKKFTV